MEEIDHIQILLSQINTISDSYIRVAEATGENFNIFSILQIESDEVRTHSRLIAELLNPKGRHNCRDKFLQLFIEENEINSEIITIESEVITEFYIGKVTEKTGGNIDILIRDNSNNVIMIENKIYAGEQKNQLLRYKNYKPNGVLIYLTLFGEESFEKSSEGLYQKCSYNVNIINWLIKCRNIAIANPILRETITQYINLIKILTNQNINKKMSENIADLVLSKDNFKAFKSLQNSFYIIIEKIINEDVFETLNDLKKTKSFEILVDEEFLSGKIYKGFTITNKSLEDKNLKIRFDFESGNFNNGILGFNYIDKQKSNLFDYKNVITSFENLFGSAITTSDNFACYTWYSELNNLHNLSVLENIRFGNFKENFKSKILEMLNIVK